MFTRRYTMVSAARLLLCAARCCALRYATTVKVPSPPFAAAARRRRHFITFYLHVDASPPTPAHHARRLITASPASQYTRRHVTGHYRTTRHVDAAPARFANADAYAYRRTRAQRGWRAAASAFTRAIVRRARHGEYPRALRALCALRAKIRREARVTRVCRADARARVAHGRRMPPCCHYAIIDVER